MSRDIHNRMPRGMDPSAVRLFSSTATKWLPALSVMLGVLLIAPFCRAQERSLRSGYLSPNMSAMAQHKLIKLPPLPLLDNGGKSDIWTIEDIKAEFARATDTPPTVNYIRTTFLRPDHEWLSDFRGWFGKLDKPLKLRFEAELWDCDNYANLFVCMADLVTMRSGGTSQPLAVGWATVFYRRPFAGINFGGHAVVIVATSRGLYVIEPQDGSMVALRDFPNVDTIETVYF